MKKRLPPVAAIACAALLMIVVVAIAPHISRSGLSRVRFDLHWPRAVMGAISGFGLALCGVVLQGVLRNPLASPYVLGISSGAAVGAFAMIRADLDLSGPLALAPIPVGALVGALAAAALVYAIASARQLAAETLILAGVAVSLFGGAIISVMHYLADVPDLRDMIMWSLGSLEVVGWTRVGITGFLVGVGVLVLLSVARRLDVASLDDASARGLGVDPVRVRKVAFFGASIITAGIVAFTGPIGFVGLVVPHAVRPFTGPDPRVLLPAAACIGAAFLVTCDLVARTAIYPANLPINVITSAIGCPAFVWILVRRSRH